MNSDRMLQKVTAGLQADNYPDIAYIYGSDLANLAERRPAPRSLPRDRRRRDRLGPLRRRGQGRGRRSTIAPRAVPAFIDNLAVVYNKEIFDQAGVDYPSDDWTWDDFLATAAKLNDPERRNRRVRLAGDRRRGHHVADLAADLAAGRRDRQRGRLQRRLRRARAARRRSGVVAQAAADGSVYIDSTAGSERMQQLFTSGKMAMNVAGPYSLPEYVDAKVDYGVALDAVVRRRAHDDRRSRHLGDLRQRRRALGSGDRVHGLVQRARAAAALDQRGRKPAADQRRQGGRGISPTTSSSLPGLDKYIDNTELARTRATIPEYPQISQAMGKAVASVLYGEADPSEALSQAVETANAELQVPGS